MENLVKRDDIFGGILMKYDKRVTTFITATDGKEEIFVKDYWTPCRTILFTIDEDNRAQDLLYDTEPCTIDGFSSSFTERSKNGYRIYNPTTLAPLLEYFNYPQELDRKDISYIPNFFTPEFFRQYCNLFGYKELNAEDLMDSKLVEAGDLVYIYCFEKRYEKLRDKGLEIYRLETIDNTEFSHDYFENLRLLSGRPLHDHRYYDIPKKDIFKPSLKKEGYKRQLIKRKTR